MKKVSILIVYLTITLVGTTSIVHSQEQHKPDLIISNVSFDEEPKLNDVYGYLSITIENKGRSDIELTASNPSKEMKISCYENNFPSEVTDKDLQLEISSTVFNLKAGVSSTFRATTIQNPPILKKTSQQKLYCMIDSSNQISEDNESNNKYILTFQINTVDVESEQANFRKKLIRANYQVSDFERTVIMRERQKLQQVDVQLSKRLSGRLLLQVEEGGEVWYVEKDSHIRFYLRNGETAYAILRAFSLGVSNSNLNKIPIGLLPENNEVDSDSDGLPDSLEDAIGTDKEKADSDNDGYDDKMELINNYDPISTNKLVHDTALTSRLNNTLLLQVEGKGEAWYVQNGKRYYLSNPETAYQAMRLFSLGVSNNDINKITIGSLDIE
jgi:hypothetical protein